MHEIMRIILAFVLLLLVSSGAFAQQPQLDRIEIDEFGVYSANKEGQVKAPDTAAGVVEQLDKMHLATSTRTVPAQAGTRFGFHFKVVGAPAGAMVPLRMVTMFPFPGLKNPVTGKRSIQNEYAIAQAIGTGAYGGYTMTDDWEVVPGVWTFQIWYLGKKMAEEKFTVAK
jgi:Domain of unknown function (DUF3859)